MESVQKFTPNKIQPATQKILDDLTYDACGTAIETSKHALWACEKVQAVWLISSPPIHSHGLRFDSFLDFLWHLVFYQHVGDELLGHSITIAWSLWKNRTS